MNPTDNLAYAAHILEFAAATNMMNSSLDNLRAYKTADRKLAPAITDIYRLSERILPRMLASCTGYEADTINILANATAQIGQMLCYLDAEGIAAVLEFAKERAEAAGQPTTC